MSYRYIQCLDVLPGEALSGKVGSLFFDCAFGGLPWRIGPLRVER